MEPTQKQKIWSVLLILAILGVGFITMISFQVNPTNSDENRKDGNAKKVQESKCIKKKEKNQKNNSENTNYSFDTDKWKAYLIALGTGLLIAGASFSSGALSGFLFGIPRIINSSAPKSAELEQNVILHNDNLVQISDWLTKIIVGVGLTQINALPGKLYKIGDMISPCFNIPSSQPNNHDLEITIAISILLYFLILGFITSYLWTRIYFGNILKIEAYSLGNQSQN